MLLWLQACMRRRSSNGDRLAKTSFSFSLISHNTLSQWKKRSERRKHCALAVVGGAKNFRPTADPVPGDAGPPKFNQLEMVTTCTHRPSLVKIDARNFEIARPPAINAVCPPARCKQTGPITIHCAAKLSAQCNKLKNSRTDQMWWWLICNCHISTRTSRLPS